MISVFQILGFGTNEIYGAFRCFGSSVFCQQQSAHDYHHLCFCIKRRRRKWGSLWDIIRVWTDKCHHHHLHHLDLIPIIAELPPRSYLILITCANDVTLRLECFGRFRPVGGSRRFQNHQSSKHPSTTIISPIIFLENIKQYLEYLECSKI